MSVAKAFGRVAHDVLDVVFPRSCVECGDVIEGSWLRHLCRTCAQLLVLVREPHCTTCGHPFFGRVEGPRICPHCEELRPVFGQGKTAILLKGPGRALVHALKYHRATHVLEDVTAIMAAVPGFADYVRDAVIVPVPLHPRKLREREYNQSLLLAECAVRAAGGQARIDPVLRRQIDTVSQTRFDRAERARNLKNAFALAPGAPLYPALRYVLLDDVFTTGSTLNSCAAVLRRAGLKNLDVVTFGHG